MKLNAIQFLAWTIALVATMSCQREAPEEPSFDRWIDNGYVTVTASRGESQKTVIQSDGSVLWSPYDSISVFYGPYDLGMFLGLNSNPEHTTVFRSQDTFAYGSIDGTSGYFFWSVNPYDHRNALSNGGVSLVVPSVQKAVAGTFAPGSFPSVAKSSNLEFRFYNLCGGLKFKVLGSGIKSVTFRGNNNELLAGEVCVDMDANNLPKVVSCSDSACAVRLVCPEGLVPGEWYYISMLPATLSKGFTIEMDNGVKTVSFVSNRNTTIKRSVFGVLSDVDQGLDYPKDWRNCDFIHRSLLLAIPNCSFSSIVVATEEGLFKEAKRSSNGNIEVIQMFANGPSPSENISSLVSALNVTTVPFEMTDFREKVVSGVTPYSTYLATPTLYGTVSGIAINSYYNGNELNVETSLYFKKADNYKLAVALVQDDSSYDIQFNSGSSSAKVTGADGVMRRYLTNITGDALTVTADNSVSYRSYKATISDQSLRQNLRVLVYVLRPYGSRQAVTNGSFGSYYVDNAISVLAGGKIELPMEVSINSEIRDFDYGGTITF